MLGVVRGDLRRLNGDSLPLLVKCLASKDQEAQGYAAFALGFSNDRAAMAPLADATRHPDETVRGNAIAALGQLGFPDTPVEPFQRLIKDPVAHIRQATLFGSLAGPKNDFGMLDSVHEASTTTTARPRRGAGRPQDECKDSVAPILAASSRIRADGPRERGGGPGSDRPRSEESTPPIELPADEYHRASKARRAEQDPFIAITAPSATWRDWYESTTPPGTRSESPASAPCACSSGSPDPPAPGPGGDVPAGGHRLLLLPRAHRDRHDDAREVRMVGLRRTSSRGSPRPSATPALTTPRSRP
jgi:hypothetical protein